MAENIQCECHVYDLGNLEGMAEYDRWHSCELMQLDLVCCIESLSFEPQDSSKSACVRAEETPAKVARGKRLVESSSSLIDVFTLALIKQACKRFSCQPLQHSRLHNFLHYLLVENRKTAQQDPRLARLTPQDSESPSPNLHQTRMEKSRAQSIPLPPKQTSRGKMRQSDV